MMRLRRHRHAKQAEPQAETRQDAAARAEIRALREARKGTAAEHPGIVVTSDSKMHRGSFVGDTFYEDRGTSFVQWSGQRLEEREHEIEERAAAVENEVTKDVWWLEQPQRLPKDNGGLTVRGTSRFR
jgi:hypothetical protein